MHEFTLPLDYDSKGGEDRLKREILAHLALNSQTIPLTENLIVTIDEAYSFGSNVLLIRLSVVVQRKIILFLTVKVLSNKCPFLAIDCHM